MLNYQNPGGSAVVNLPIMQEMQKMWVWSLGQEDPLEEEIATHSSILVWKIPWTEELSGLQSIGSQTVGPDWVHTQGDSQEGKSPMSWCG